MKRITDPRLRAIWNATHRDYRGVVNGVRTILVLRAGGTTLVPLSDLTETEIAYKLPRNYQPTGEAK